MWCQQLREIICSSTINSSRVEAISEGLHHPVTVVVLHCKNCERKKKHGGVTIHLNPVALRMAKTP